MQRGVGRIGRTRAYGTFQAWAEAMAEASEREEGVERGERVTIAMRALGYVYHRGAASLRAASSDFVGMVISDLTNPFFAELAVGIEDALYKLGFTPILANTNENPEPHAPVRRSLREHKVAGIIISPA